MIRTPVFVLITVLAMVFATFAVGPASNASTSASTESGPARAAKVHPYWRLDFLCRRSADPAIQGPACKKRDRIMKDTGRQRAGNLIEAWRRGDQATVNRISANDILISTDRNRATKRPADCKYDSSEPRWSCWVQARARGQKFFLLLGFEVTRFAPPRAPRWQLITAAPDA